jgi:hypothetical protein
MDTYKFKLAYVNMCKYVCMYILYIYIYICLCMYIYIYIYIGTGDDDSSELTEALLL